MNKRKIIFIMLLCFCIKTKAQLFLPVGAGFDAPVRTLFTDTINNIMYIGTDYGWLANGDSSHYVSAYDGTNWTYFGNTFTQQVKGFCRFNGKIYAAGPYIFKEWNGSAWNDVLDSALQGFIYTIYSDGNYLYVGGQFSQIEGVSVNNFARWDGTTWDNLSMPSACSHNVQAIINYQNKIFIGGFIRDPNNCNGVGYMYFDGTTWQTDGAGIVGVPGSGWVYDFEIYNGELYIGGGFCKVDGNVGTHVVKWVNGQLYDVGGGMYEPYPQCVFYTVEIEEYNNELYAVGTFEHTGGIPAYRLAKWDGTNWCSLGLDSAGTGWWNLEPQAIGSVKGDLYIGGVMPIVNGDTVWHLVKWNGGNYVAGCGNIIGINEFESEKNDFEIFPNPSNNTVTISFENNENSLFQLNLYNSLGKIAMKKTLLPQSGKINSTIDISELPTGIYFLKIQADKKYLSKIFIKQ